MAEDDGNTQAAGNATEAQAGPQFVLQQLYLKDCSFESPRSPQVFQSRWQPKIKFEVKTRSDKVQENVYEVVLMLTVEAKLEEESVFLVEIQQAGIFTIKDLKESDLERVLATVCPNILFPYAREGIDSLVVRGSFPPLMLSPLNFDALYEQGKQQQEAAGKAAPAPKTVQ